jgi:membrane protease subunit HflK
VGSASRLKEEADAYKARIIAQAQGDAQRFSSVLTEYQKAPQVTRDRMYTDAMQQVYTNVTKVMVESRQGSNLLYLPIDKIMQMTSQEGVATSANGSLLPSSSNSSSAVTQQPPVTSPLDPRTRDASRTRERETR